MGMKIIIGMTGFPRVGGDRPLDAAFERVAFQVPPRGRG